MAQREHETIQALNELLLGTMSEEEENRIASDSIYTLLVVAQNRISVADLAVWHAVESGWSSDEELKCVLDERSAAFVSFIRIKRAEAYDTAKRANKIKLLEKADKALEAEANERSRLATEQSRVYNPQNFKLVSLDRVRYLRTRAITSKTHEVQCQNDLAKAILKVYKLNT